jgi:flagellar basal body-associated protein FliL
MLLQIYLTFRAESLRILNMKSPHRRIRLSISSQVTKNRETRRTILITTTAILILTKTTVLLSAIILMFVTAACVLILMFVIAASHPGTFSQHQKSQYPKRPPQSVAQTEPARTNTIPHSPTSLKLSHSDSEIARRARHSQPPQMDQTKHPPTSETLKPRKDASDFIRMQQRPQREIRLSSSPTSDPTPKTRRDADNFIWTSFRLTTINKEYYQHLHISPPHALWIL